MRFWEFVYGLIGLGCFITFWFSRSEATMFLGFVMFIFSNLENIKRRLK